MTQGIDCPVKKIRGSKPTTNMIFVSGGVTADKFGPNPSCIAMKLTSNVEKKLLEKVDLALYFFCDHWLTKQAIKSAGHTKSLCSHSTSSTNTSIDGRQPEKKHRRPPTRKKPAVLAGKLRSHRQVFLFDLHLIQCQL